MRRSVLSELHSSESREVLQRARGNNAPPGEEAQHGQEELLTRVKTAIRANGGFLTGRATLAGGGYAGP